MSSTSPSLSVISIILLVILNLSLVSGNQSTGIIQLPSEKTKKIAICEGTVIKPGSCPVKCFRANPVCGEDSVTYWCGCSDALCNGVGVAKLGACDVGNGVGASITGQALQLIHIVWLMLIGFSMVFGLF